VLTTVLAASYAAAAAQGQLQVRFVLPALAASAGVAAFYAAAAVAAPDADAAAVAP
jgi:hypothetical protein